MNHDSAVLLAWKLFSRSLLFAGIWMLLVGTDPLAWIVGGPAVIAATVASLKLTQVTPSAPARTDGSSLSWLELPRFIAFFMWESWRGGLDVAARVMRPRLRIRPGMRIYHTRLRGRPARVMFIDCVSLIPGTLSADLRGDQVSVHALDVGVSLDADLRRLEERVARLFGEALEPQPATASMISAQAGEGGQ
ncbi:MAG: cation transporter [Sphingobacteriia bacterium]|nr:cation transporter [Sphingobacteriia bacterium]NCC39272.1 cation transporter [Gammaproteobacteria bacterium]